MKLIYGLVLWGVVGDDVVFEVFVLLRAYCGRYLEGVED